MTEEERLWSGYRVPQWLLDLVREKTTRRKLRLLACAFVRDQWDLIWDDRSRAAVEAAERYADGECTLDEMLSAKEAAASVAADALCNEPDEPATRAARLAVATTIEDAYTAAYTGTLSVPTWYPSCVGYGGEFNDACDQQRPLLYDIFDDSFMKVDLETDWPVVLRAPVVALARDIYANHEFDRMPELGDLLESSLCQHRKLIRHCREAKRHLRGCWALDAILGRT